MAKSSNLLSLYQQFLDQAAGVGDECLSDSQFSSLPPSLKVGVVGGGMVGLYSASLLQRYIPGVRVKLFEASERVGGCVYTHRFSPKPYQYFEAGAMRLPCIEAHQPVFTLIEYLNKQFPEDPIELIDFNYLSPEANRVYVNGTKQKNGSVMSVEYATKHCSELGFLEEFADGDTASKLYSDAMKPVADALAEDFERALKKYGAISVRDYFLKELGWSDEKINYVEVMCFQTGAFRLGLLDTFFLDGACSHPKTWKTIQGGMSKLPELCAEDIKKKGGVVLLNAKVESLTAQANGVRIGYSQPKRNQLEHDNFDAVILAIPPWCVRMMPERSRFGADLEYALRLCRSDRASKLGLRFKSRFWERTDLQLPLSYGGQSITDLPSRWVVYPDYGVGDSGKGVLHTYCRENDSNSWCLLSKAEKLKLALRDLQLLYPEVDIAKEYAGGKPTDEGYLEEAFSMDWWSMFCYDPGQFLRSFPVMARPQRDIYFAGAHLSSSPVWIQGALESSRRTVQQLALKYGIKYVDYISNSLDSML